MSEKYVFEHDIKKIKETKGENKVTKTAGNVFKSILLTLISPANLVLGSVGLNLYVCLQFILLPITILKEILFCGNGTKNFFKCKVNLGVVFIIATSLIYLVAYDSFHIDVFAKIPDISKILGFYPVVDKLAAWEVKYTNIANIKNVCMNLKTGYENVVLSHFGFVTKNDDINTFLCALPISLGIGLCVTAYVMFFLFNIITANFTVFLIGVLIIIAELFFKFFHHGDFEFKEFMINFNDDNFKFKIKFATFFSAIFLYGFLGAIPGINVFIDNKINGKGSKCVLLSRGNIILTAIRNIL